MDYEGSLARIIFITMLIGIIALDFFFHLRRKKKLRAIVMNANYEYLRGKAVIVNGKNYKNNSLEGLTLRGLKISDVSEIFGLEQLSKLEKLNLANNNLTSIKGLENLEKLRLLNLSRNKITDLSGIENLTSLVNLNLYHNNIVDCSPLSMLSNLHELDIKGNDLNDLEPFRGMRNFRSFNEKRRIVLPILRVVLIVAVLFLVSFGITLLILLIPYSIVNAAAHALGTEYEITDYWNYVFQSGNFWPAFLLVFIFSPLIIFIAWKILEDY